MKETAYDGQLLLMEDMRSGKLINVIICGQSDDGTKAFVLDEELESRQIDIRVLRLMKQNPAGDGFRYEC